MLGFISRDANTRREGGGRKSSLCREKVVCKMRNRRPGRRKAAPSPAAAGRLGCSRGAERLGNSTRSPAGLSGARPHPRIPRVDVSWHFRKFRLDLKSHQREEYSFNVLRSCGIRIIPANAAYRSMHGHVLGLYLTPRHPGLPQTGTSRGSRGATCGQVPPMVTVPPGAAYLAPP